MTDRPHAIPTAPRRFRITVLDMAVAYVARWITAVLRSRLLVDDDCVGTMAYHGALSSAMDRAHEQRFTRCARQ